MKKIIVLLCLLFPFVVQAQNNNELTTLRIGPYNLQMKAEEAEKIAGKKLKLHSEIDKYNSILYNGNEIRINISGEADGEKYISQMITTSPAFKTKRGIGVGSTKRQVFEKYMDYPNFSVYQGYDEDSKPIKGETYFSLEDRDAGSMLEFKFINDVVVEAAVFYNYY